MPQTLAGTPPAIGLPSTNRSGSQAVRRGVAAGPGGDGVRLVDQQQRAGSRASARAAPSWKPGSGSTMQQLVSTGSVMTQATSLPASAFSSAAMSLNSTTLVCFGQVAELAGEAAAG